MPRKSVYISLTKGSKLDRRHPKEVSPPLVVKAKNVYTSPADGALTLRPDTVELTDTFYDCGSEEYISGVFWHPSNYLIRAMWGMPFPLHAEQFGMHVIHKGESPDTIDYSGPYRTTSLSTKTGDDDTWGGDPNEDAMTGVVTALGTQDFGYLYDVIYDSGTSKYYFLGWKSAYGSVPGIAQAIPALDDCRRGAATTNRAVLVKESGKLYTTTNYSTLTECVTSDLIVARDVVYSSALSKFCAVGYHGKAAISTNANGTDYTVSTINANIWFFRLIYSNLISKFVAGGTKGTIATSADGSTWTVETSNPNKGSIQGIAEDPANIIVAARIDGGVGTVILTSTDGTNWTEQATLSGKYFTSLIWDGTKFIAGGSGGIAVSSDGISWTEISAPEEITDSLGGTLAYVNGKTFVLQRGNGLYADDITATTSGNMPQTIFPISKSDSAYGVAYDRIICQDGDNLIVGPRWTSERTVTLMKNEGAEKYRANTGTTRSLNAMVKDSIGYYVGCGLYGVITVFGGELDVDFGLVSDSGVSVELKDIAVNSSGRFVVVGEDTILYSDDYVTWNAASGATTGDWFAVCQIDGLWVAAATTGDVAYSSDGSTWTSAGQVYTPIIEPVRFLFAYGGKFLLGGDDGIVFTSDPSGSWSSAFSSESFVAGGTDGVAIYLLHRQYSNARNYLWNVALESEEKVEIYIGKFGESQELQRNVNHLIRVTSNRIWFFDRSVSFDYIENPIVPPTIDPDPPQPDKEMGRSGCIGTGTFNNAVTFASVDGQVVVFNTEEEDSDGKIRYYRRRARWSAPGTFDVFDPNDSEYPGAGYDDYVGDGEFLLARRLGHNILIWETACVSLFSQTGFVEAPWEYVRLREGLSIASNPVIVDDRAYFVASDGLVYVANSVSVNEAGFGVDLSKYADTGGVSNVWLSHCQTLNALLIYQPSETPVMHVVSLDSGAVTEWTLPSLKEGDETYSYPLGIGTLPAGAGDSTIYVFYAGQRMVMFGFNDNIDGEDYVRDAEGSESSNLVRHWHAEIELGELPIDGDGQKIRLFRVLPRTYCDGTTRPDIMVESRDAAESTWNLNGDSTGTIEVLTNGAAEGTNTVWSNKIADGDGTTDEFATPYLAAAGGFYIDGDSVGTDDYIITDTKQIKFDYSPPPAGTVLYQYWTNEPNIVMSVGDYIYDETYGHYYRITSINRYNNLSMAWENGESANSVGYHCFAEQLPSGEGESKLKCGGLYNAPQLRLVVVPRENSDTTVAKVLGLTVEYVPAGVRVT